MSPTVHPPSIMPSHSISHPQHFKGVKALVDAGIDHVPDLYIRPAEQVESAVAACPDVIDLPVFDLTLLYGPGRDSLVQAIGRACQEWGFFQVVNHGVPDAVMDKMYRVGLAFFDLPSEEKMVYFSTDPKSQMRYSTSFNVREDKVLNWRDFLRFSCVPFEEMIPKLPSKPTEFREATAEFCKRVRELTGRLLEAISESLGLGADHIQAVFGSYSQIVALNYYPECPVPDVTLGIPPHSDPGGVSVLMQGEVEGLQVRHKDRWVAVKPISHAFVVNLGDQLQILSNGRYKSVEHRATVNSTKARMTIVNANGPSFERVIAPARELVDEDHPAAYRESLYGDFMLKVQSKSLDRKSVLDTLKI